MTLSPILHPSKNKHVLQAILSLSVLNSLDPVKINALQTIGIHSLSQLLHYQPIHNARLITAVAQGQIAHDINLAYLLDASYREIPPHHLSAAPVEALLDIGPKKAGVFNNVFKVMTIEQLAYFRPFTEAQSYLSANDNSFNEPQSAPAELLPRLIGATTSSVRYSSIVREKDLRDMRIFGTAQLDSQIFEIFINQESPVIYLGYVAGFVQKWINRGTHLGEIVHSIPLAPGESRNIAILDWKRNSIAQRDEQTNVVEQINSVQVHKRALDEVARAVAEEHQFGKTNTEANTGATAGSFVAAGAVVGGIGGGIAGAITGLVVGNAANIAGGLPTIGGAVAGSALGGAAGAAAGGLVYSGASALGMIESDSSGQREIVGEVQQRIMQSTSQKSSAIRSLWSAVVLEDFQAESQDITTSNITNYNHMHALTVQYYEVLQHYYTEIKFARAEPLLFLPFNPLSFDNEQIGILMPYLMDALKSEISKELYSQAFDEIPKPDEQTEGEETISPLPGEVPFNPDKAMLTKAIVRAETSLGNNLIGIEIVTDDALLPLHHRTTPTPGSNGLTPPAPLQGANLPPDHFDPLKPAEGRRDHFGGYLGLSGWPIPIHKINKLRVLNTSGFPPTGFATTLRIQYTISEGLKVESVQDWEYVASVSVSPGSSEDVEWKIEDRLAAKYQAYVDDKERDDAAEQTQQVSEAERQAMYEAALDKQQEALAQVYQIIKWKKYHFTRVILNFIEPEQITHILDSLEINGVMLHAIAHTVPIGIAGNHLILKLKKSPGYIDPSRRTNTSASPTMGAVIATSLETAFGALLNHANHLPGPSSQDSYKSYLETLLTLMEGLIDQITVKHIAATGLKREWLRLQDSLEDAYPQIRMAVTLWHSFVQGDNIKPFHYSIVTPLITQIQNMGGLIANVDAMQENLSILLNYANDVIDWMKDENKHQTISDDVYLPTSGVFAEAILGRSNAAEKLDISRFFNWQDSPIPNQAPVIAATNPNQSRPLQLDVTPTLPPASINLVNPINFPDATGLTSVLDAVQQGDIFRDMSKSDQLTTTLGNLSALAAEIGKASAQMTGDAAKQALQSATAIGKEVAAMTQALMNSAERLAANPPSNITEKGITHNALKDFAEQAEQTPAGNSETIPSGIGDAFFDNFGIGNTDGVVSFADFSSGKNRSATLWHKAPESLSLLPGLLQKATPAKWINNGQIIREITPGEVYSNYMVVIPTSGQVLYLDGADNGLWMATFPEFFGNTGIIDQDILYKGAASAQWLEKIARVEFEFMIGAIFNLPAIIAIRTLAFVQAMNTHPEEAGLLVEYFPTIVRELWWFTKTFPRAASCLLMESVQEVFQNVPAALETLSPEKWAYLLGRFLQGSIASETAKNVVKDLSIRFTLTIASFTALTVAPASAANSLSEYAEALKNGMVAEGIPLSQECAVTILEELNSHPDQQEIIDKMTSLKSSAETLMPVLKELLIESNIFLL